MAVNANALTTLATAKAYLKIPVLVTTEDVIVELFINSSSDLIERETDRKLKSQAIVEKQHGRRQNLILLREFPVTAVSELRVDPAAAFTDPSTLIAATDYQIADDGNGLVLLNGRVFGDGYNNVRVSYTAGYAAVPSDLEHACLWLVTWYHSIRNANDIGRVTKNKDAETVSYVQSAPQDVKDCIARYKRSEFFVANAPVTNL